MGDEAEELLKHRFAINNIWRPIAGPLLRSPLAPGDAETLDTENLVLEGSSRTEGPDDQPGAWLPEGASTGDGGPLVYFAA